MKKILPFILLLTAVSTAFGAAGDVIFKQINSSGTSIVDRPLPLPTPLTDRIYGLSGSAEKPAQFIIGSGLSLTGSYPSTLILSSTGLGGTVTSVGLSMPSGFSVANSPVTTAGTLMVTTTLSGIIVGDGSGFIARTITGTANEITITNGTGISGNPTISLPSALTFTGKTITGGTYTGGAFNGTVGASTPNTGAFTTVAAGQTTITATSDLGGLVVTGSVNNISLGMINAASGGNPWVFYSTATGSGYGAGKLLLANGVAGSPVAEFTTAGLNNTVIGATTPAAATFTTANVGTPALANGDLNLFSNNAASNGVALIAYTGASPTARFALGTSARISGAGSDQSAWLVSYSDDVRLQTNNGAKSIEFVVASSTTGSVTSTGFQGTIGATTQNPGSFTSLSKTSGTFRIDHPLKSKEATHYLVHSFVEGPRADLIYRGSCKLSKGCAVIALDKEVGMTEGTFEALTKDPQVWVTSADGWTPVRGSVTNGNLIISSKDSVDETVSWLVVAQRDDKAIRNADWTDKNGKPILEPEKAVDLAESKRLNKRVLKAVVSKVLEKK